VPNYAPTMPSTCVLGCLVQYDPFEIRKRLHHISYRTFTTVTRIA